MARRRRNAPAARGDTKKNRGSYTRHDAYYHKAKAAGYAARSVYKLDEIQQRFKLIKKGARVLDLGCAPGAWLQLAAQLVGQNGRVVGIDLNGIKLELPVWVKTLQGDIRETSPEQLTELGGGTFHVALSDLAAHTTGIRSFDQARTAQLIEDAFALAAQVLKAGGAFACKIFDGPDVKRFVRQLEQRFAKVQILRPQATRSHSKEIYIIAKNYRPQRPVAEARGDKMEA